MTGYSTIHFELSQIWQYVKLSLDKKMLLNETM